MVTLFISQYLRRDLNPHGRNAQQILSLSCIPISSLRQILLILIPFYIGANLLILIYEFFKGTGYLRMRSPLCCKSIVTLNNFMFYQYFLSQGNNTMLLIVLEYPSRSNLNCLIVVLRGLGRKGDEFRFHSGLSTSVEWGKPLSILLLFQRT